MLQDITEEDEEEREHLHLPENYKMSIIKKARCNQDQHKNTYGEKLIDMTVSSNMKILNGRTLGDLEGRYTYIGYNGLSTVDYVLGTENIFTNNIIHSFEVEEITNFSDHRPTRLTIQYNAIKDTNKVDNESEYSRPRNKQTFIKDYETYKNELNTKMDSNFIDPLLKRIESINMGGNPADLDAIIQTINNTYLNKVRPVPEHYTNKQRMNNKNKNKMTKDKAWYTNDCKTMKKRLIQARKMLEKNPEKQDLRILYYKTNKQYKKLVKFQRRKYEENLTYKLEHLYTNDKNAFWKHLKALKNNTQTENLPQLNKLITHFENLFFKEELDENLMSNTDEQKENPRKAFFDT